MGEPGEVIEVVKQAVISEVNDDLNFPKALAHIWDMVHRMLTLQIKRQPCSNWMPC